MADEVSVSGDIVERNPACTDPSTCHLHSGMVVQYVGPNPDRYTRRTVRGIATIGHVREGERLWGMAGPVAVGDAIIQHSPGMQTVTNMHADWAAVPEVEWSTEERVRCEALRWRAPDWRGADDNPEAEVDSYAFAIVRGLLTPAERDEAFPEDGDWPCSMDEIVLAVAQAIDTRTATLLAVVSGSLGTPDA
jgi:hypothetical protein